MKHRLWWGLAGMLALTFIVELLYADRSYGKFWWSRVPGWEIILGFIGCLALIYGGKALGKHVVQRREGYYNQR